jgi:hypothetical protein
VLAPELSRQAIIEALLDRRTYAVTGDRIALRFTLNGKLMGRELPYAPERAIRVAVSGWDQVDRVELLKNNRVIRRDFPGDRATSAQSWSRPVLARFEYGWGPWPALGITRVCDWDFTIRLENGVLDAVQTCFLPGPLEEDRSTASGVSKPFKFTLAARAPLVGGSARLAQAVIRPANLAGRARVVKPYPTTTVKTQTRDEPRRR